MLMLVTCHWGVIGEEVYDCHNKDVDISCGWFDFVHQHFPYYYSALFFKFDNDRKKRGSLVIIKSFWLRQQI